MKPIAISLMSGGIDSTVATYIAKYLGYEVYGLTINRGQTAQKEIEYAIKIGEKMKLLYHPVVDISSIKKVLESVIKDQKTEKGTYHIIPFRNALLLSIAVAFAESVNADYIFTGIRYEDSTYFPDNSKQFIDAFQKVIIKSTAKKFYKVPTIELPLCDLTRESVIILGVSLEVPFELTWSCYKNREKHCGTCLNCVSRKWSFNKLKIKDPTEYEGDD